MQSSVNIEGPVLKLDFLTKVGHGCVTEHIVSKRGMFLLENQANVETVVAKLLLSSFVKLSALHVKRSASNTTLKTMLLPILLYHVSSLRLRELYNTVNVHWNCLTEIKGVDFLVAP